MKENYSSFYARLSEVPLEDRMDIDLAYSIAKHAHRHQRRKEQDEDGKPLRYFEHPKRVAIIVMDEAECNDPTLIIAALLHDGIEDTRILTFERIKHWFGRDVASIVQLLTKTGDDYTKRLSTSADWRPLLLKACDRLDNLRSLKAGSADFQKKQIIETKEKYYPIFDLLKNIAPEKYKRGVKNVVNEIRDLVSSWELERGIKA